REVLQTLARSRTAPHRQVQRARVVLLAADGVANTKIAASVGVSPATVKSWRERFEQEGLKDLGVVRPGRGRKPQISLDRAARSWIGWRAVSDGDGAVSGSAGAVVGAIGGA
ncbi:MAG: helix-turn-helix domain-containing protein, partial [Solirubrobacteraceae bacterium]